MKPLEVQLRESFIKLYKDDVGKGPVQTNVGVTKNYIVVEFNGIFTPLETSLLHTSDGIELIGKLRKIIKARCQEHHAAEVERLLGCKVIDFLSKLSIEKDTLYFLFILDKMIER